MRKKKERMKDGRGASHEIRAKPDYTSQECSYAVREQTRRSQLRREEAEEAQENGASLKRGRRTGRMFREATESLRTPIPPKINP